MPDQFEGPDQVEGSELMVERLAAGRLFPATTIKLSDDSLMTLPADMAAGYKVMLFFRGSW